MKKTVRNNLIKKYLSFQMAGISSLFSRAILTVVVSLLAIKGMAQTYNTQANGNWSDPATWIGGVVPSPTIAAGTTINIKHNVTFDVNGSGITISGTLNISGDTLYFPSN